MKRSNEEKEDESDAIKIWNHRYNNKLINFFGFMAF